MSEAIQITGSVAGEFAEILTPGALAFVARLQREFGPGRQALLQRRAERQMALDNGDLPDFLPETTAVRQGDWRVANTPDDLQMRRVEITGPVERKMMINALNSEANVFMADCEDALSPTWENIVQGQINLRDAVRRTIEFANPDGRIYKLNEQTAVLLVRPRGWHLYEKHALLDGEPVSASLFDFGLYFFHNAAELLRRGSGPYFYLPKMESHREARLWNDVFNFAQDDLGIARGSIRATVLIETIMAAFEMDEILYELRDHAAGLNAGRWDYIFSAIKKLRKQENMLLPDRAQITMTVPFMRSYTELLVQTCHKRGAHAMGGMAAFIPNRREPDITANALAKVREDKEREASDGFDGTWVAHPDLVPVAMAAFDKVIGARPNQKERQREDVFVTAGDLLNMSVPNGTISEAGVRTNISVGLQYINAWLLGNGAAAINNLMEDAATAEISRAQLWQWLYHRAKLSDGRQVSQALYKKIRDEEFNRLISTGAGRFEDAARILDGLVLREDFSDFLTIPAYTYLD